MHLLIKLTSWNLTFQIHFIPENVRVTNRMTPEELRSVWPDPCFDREAMVQLLDHDNLEMRKVKNPDWSNKSWSEVPTLCVE